eukprot:491378-Pyramimonas_sp.AAC.1
MRVSDLGGRSITATSNTADTVMIRAMMATMLATTTGHSVTAPLLLTAATMTAASRRWKEFGMLARQTRKSGTHGIKWLTSCQPSTRATAFERFRHARARSRW